MILLVTEVQLNLQLLNKIMDSVQRQPVLVHEFMIIVPSMAITLETWNVFDDEIFYVIKKPEW